MDRTSTVYRPSEVHKGKQGQRKRDARVQRRENGEAAATEQEERCGECSKPTSRR
jgi:hypothetical protein